MTTKIYFAGGGLDSLEVTSDPTAVVRETTDGAIAGYSTVTVRIGGNSSTFRARMYDPDSNLPTPVAVGSLWFHMLYRESNFNGTTSGTAAGRNFQINKNDGTGLIRCRKTGNTNGTFILDYWNGAAWVNVAAPNATAALAAGVWRQVDVQIVLGDAEAGAVRFYVEKELIFEAAGIDTSTWNVGYVDFFSPSTQNNTVSDTGFQQIIFAEKSTLDFALRQRAAPTGSGDDTAWVGDYTALDETTYSDADFITSAVVGDKESVTGGAYAALASATEVKAVIVGARVRHDNGTPPQNVKSFITVGGADFDAPANMRIGTNFNGSINIFNKNPNTGADWGAALPAATDQYGLKSAT